MVGGVSGRFDGLAGIEESFGGNANTRWSSVVVMDDADCVREDLVVMNDRCLDQRGQPEVKSFECDVFELD